MEAPLVRADQLQAIFTENFSEFHAFSLLASRGKHVSCCRCTAGGAFTGIGCRGENGAVPLSTFFDMTEVRGLTPGVSGGGNPQSDLYMYISVLNEGLAGTGSTGLEAGCGHLPRGYLFV